MVLLRTPPTLAALLVTTDMPLAPSSRKVWLALTFSTLLMAWKQMLQPFRGARGGFQKPWQVLLSPTVKGAGSGRFPGGSSAAKQYGDPPLRAVWQVTGIWQHSMAPVSRFVRCGCSSSTTIWQALAKERKKHLSLKGPAMAKSLVS